ncbi:hypothetical protein ACFWG6_09585 [Streptomyces erythrochromogenes]
MRPLGWRRTVRVILPGPATAPASAEDVIQNLSDNGPDKLLFTNGL